MQLHDLLQHLKGVKGNGNQYQAQCPAHKDNSPSLSVSIAEGKILLHCHTGCTTENIISAMGLEMKDLFTEERTTPQYSNNSKPKREITAVYDYKDLNGNIVHSTVRYNPKGFSQRRPDPDKHGEYIWKDVFKGITPILYNLQAVTNAIKEKQPVFVVEGEKDCENLTKLGFVATTCPMGADKWKPHYSAMLKGASTVFIIADNDEVGNNHVQNVAKSLVGKAEAVCLIDLMTTMPDLPKGGDISDFLELTPQNERKTAVEGLMTTSVPFVSDGKEPPQEKTEGNSSNGKPSQAELLLNIVETTETSYFHSDIKELYAAIRVDNHVEIMPIESRDFMLWLNRLFYNEYGKPISKDALKQASSVLSAKALYDNPVPVKLSTRVAEHDGAFWYDLTNKNWSIIKITGEGWEVVEHDPTLIFERHNHQSPQTIPRKGGDIQKILQYINIKENKTLFLCDLISKFIPNIPHPMPDFHGEKGAAKSTASVILKLLIDPSRLRTLALPKDDRDFVCVFREHWFVPFDNIGFITADISNMLCRVIMGDGIQQRRLHTNADSVIYEFQRCIAVNGIDIVPTKSDLLDRTILFELMRIEDNNRRELSEVMASFEADKADILGGIFDTLVKAIAIYPTVKLRGLKRMADFTRWGYAIGEALGGLGNEFLAEYQQNYERQNDEVLNNDPVATLTVEFMKDQHEWYGTHTQLHDKFKDLAEQCAIDTRSKNFPNDAAALGRRLRSIMSNLRQEGIWYIPEKRKKYGVPLTLKKQNNHTPPTPSYTQAVNTANNQGFEGVGIGVGLSEKGVGIMHPTNELTPYHTPNAIADKAPNYHGFNGHGCRVYDGVGKNAPLEEQYKDWFTVAEDISNDDIPPEFLTPTPPAQQMSLQQTIPLQ